MLYNDAEVDGDICKAVLETLNALCEAEEGTAKEKELGMKCTDVLLENEKPVHTLVGLMADTGYYTRLGALQLLLTLLKNKRQPVQSYFLTSPTGPTGLLSTLEDKREVIRNGVYSLCERRNPLM